MIGGKDKKLSIREGKGIYVASDNIEIGYGNKIPGYWKADSPEVPEARPISSYRKDAKNQWSFFERLNGL